MKAFLTFIFCLVLFGSCKKDQPLTKTDLYAEVPFSTPSSSAIATFYKSTAYYQLFVYRYDPSTAKWTNRIVAHYPTISTSDNSFMGFGNPYVADSGAPVFDMVKLYTTALGHNNIKTARINVDKVLQFFPDYEGSKTGVVKILKQGVVLTKTDGSTFTIGISGGGTYSEVTQLIDLEVIFDETAIDGAGQTVKYKMSVTALTLN